MCFGVLGVPRWRKGPAAQSGIALHAYQHAYFHLRLFDLVWTGVAGDAVSEGAAPTPVGVAPGATSGVEGCFYLFYLL